LRRLPTMTTASYGLAMEFPFDAGAGLLPCGQPSQIHKRCKCMDCGKFGTLADAQVMIRQNGNSRPSAWIVTRPCSG
jgi:hypothetical protein